MLFVVIHFFLLSTLFYTINLIDWDLIYTYFHFLILGEINFPQNQDFIGGFTKIFSTIYCSEVDPSFNKNLNSESSYLGDTAEGGVSVNNSSLKSLPTITINHNIPGLHSIGQAITTVGEGLTNYAPVTTIGVIAMSTSKILITIPAPHRAKISLALTGLMVGATAIAQGRILRDPPQTFNLIKNSSSEVSSLSFGSESNNLQNIEEALTSSIIDLQFINSSLETINPEDCFLLAIFIFASSGLYALFSLTISLLIKEFSPENHPFVTARPRLLWYFKFLGKSNKITIAFFLLLVAAAFGFILISASYLRTEFIKGV